MNLNCSDSRVEVGVGRAICLKAFPPLTQESTACPNPLCDLSGPATDNDKVGETVNCPLHTTLHFGALQFGGSCSQDPALSAPARPAMLILSYVCIPSPGFSVQRTISWDSWARYIYLTQHLSPPSPSPLPSPSPWSFKEKEAFLGAPLLVR